MTDKQKDLALVYQPGIEQPQLRYIDGNDFRELQALVGGMIELVNAGPGLAGGTLDLVVNEEGRLIGLPWNRLIGGTHALAGPIVVIAHDDEGNARGLTAEEAEAVVRWMVREGRMLKGDAFEPQHMIMVNPTREQIDAATATDVAALAAQQAELDAADGRGEV